MQDILIVEDGLHERERLTRLFSAANFSVSCAENAEEAEKLLGTIKFRLVVLDIGLEDKSGSHLFQQIKSTEEKKLVRFIAVAYVNDPALIEPQQLYQIG